MTTRTSGSRAQRSVAPTASAAAPPAGPATEPNDGPAEPSLPAGATSSVPRSRAPWAAHASGPSVKAAYGSTTPDDGDPHGVVRVTVAVRVDRALEPGDQLVAARVDELAAVGRRLPAGDANRQDRRSGGDAVQAVRPVGAGDDPRHLGAVTLDLRRILGIGVRARVERSADDVEAGQHLAAQVGMRQVDAGVEQRDRDAAAVVAGQRPRRAGDRSPRRTPSPSSSRSETEAGNAGRTG